jgi:hypothetical protein
MNYALIAGLLYLVMGIVLTRTVFKAPTMRLRFKDVIIGATLMPLLFIALLLSVFFEDLWKRLLIALDYNPPEEMRAGPKDSEDV